MHTLIVWRHHSCQLQTPPIGGLCKFSQLLAEAIRFHRKKANLTQEMLAERASLNPKYIGEVERGLKNISVDALIRIADATKVPIREFFKDI